MTLPPGNFTSLPGIDRITDATFDEQISENLIAFFDWGLLGIGAFFNVKRPSVRSKFHPVDTPNFVFGRVWETSKGNWVWENNIPYSLQPTQISGVYIDDVFVPKDTGYYINYPDGQIIFDEPVASTSRVEMNFSYRRFNLYESDSDWFHQVVFDPLPESGVRDILAKNRVYLPAVIIEVIPDTTFTPLQLGDNSVIENQSVLFHIISDNDEDRNKFIYILKRMYNKTIWFYNTNKVAQENKFPLTPEGSVSSNALTYPGLIEEFAWKKCIFSNIRPQDITSQLPLYRAVVRATLQVYMP